MIVYTTYRMLTNLIRYVILIIDGGFMKYTRLVGDVAFIEDTEVTRHRDRVIATCEDLERGAGDMESFGLPELAKKITFQLEMTQVMHFELLHPTSTPLKLVA